MQFCFKYARVFWVVAILMMAGGQLAHSYQDSSCATEHASERTSSKDQTDCPMGHSCCKSHSHVIGAVAEAPTLNFVSPNSSDFIDCGVRVVEGPTREIDYPPQLS